MTHNRGSHAIIFRGATALRVVTTVAEVRLMKTGRLLPGSLIAIGLAVTLSAQQAGENINVRPVHGADPLRGDAYLQRQVEPSLAVSTRNPQHLIAFFNDYRAVDV